MPRDGNGNYTLPAGNPVVSNTLIEATWANTTMPDLGTETTDSLSRSGKGPMLAPLRIVDADLPTPGLSFQSEPTSGILRQAAGDIRHRVLGTDVVGLTQTTVTAYVNQVVNGTLTLSGNISGNVGINGAPLNATNITDLSIHGGSQGSLISLRDNAANRKTELSWDPSSNAGFVGTFSSDPFQIRTGNLARVIVDSSGNVGVNDPNPGNLFSVRGGGTSLGNIVNCQMTVGDTSGTANAGLALVSGTTNNAILYMGDSANAAIGQILYDNTNDQMELYTNALRRFYLDSAGRMFVPAVYATTVTSARDVQVDVSGQFGYVTSSKRYKKHIKLLEDSDFVSRLRPVEYDREDGTHEIGLLAEDVEEVAPQYVWRDEQGRPDGVDYKGLIVPILARLQQLEARIP